MRNRWWRGLPGALGVALCLLAGAVPADAAPSIGPYLAEALAGTVPEEGLRVIVTLRRGDLPREAVLRRERMLQRIDAVAAPLRGGGFRPARRYPQLGGFAGRLDRAAIEALSRNPLVELVYLDRTARPSLAEGKALIGATPLADYGVDGAGVSVAVVDSGVDFSHPDLAGARIDEHCFCNNGGGCCPLGGTEESGVGSAADGIGHGTSVAGIVASRGLVSDPGVAPAAGIVAVRVFSAAGQSSFSDIAAGLEWLWANRVALGLRAVNLSLGDNQEYNSSSGLICHLSATARAIADLHDAGVAVFVASGNDGYEAGVSFPACVAEAVAVGGVYDASLGTVAWCVPGDCGQTLCTDTNVAADDFVCHTNAGNPLDLLAPDWKTTVPAAGGGTQSFGGTSASAPYAAGMAALLYQAAPSLDAVAVEGLMTSHGPGIVDPRTAQVYPRTDVQGAVLAAATIDADGDGVPDDGDGSGVLSDAPCSGGATTGCDDNCPFVADASQADADADAVGDVCDVCPQVWNPGQDPTPCTASVPALSPVTTLVSALALAALAAGAAARDPRRGRTPRG